jgi:hypothetical protein
MSTKVIAEGTTFCALKCLASLANLSSGISTTPTFLSIVQKGKFSAGTDIFVRALKIVDFPTLGNPTIPNEKECDCLIDMGGLYNNN